MTSYRIRPWLQNVTQNGGRAIRWAPGVVALLLMATASAMGQQATDAAKTPADNARKDRFLRLTRDAEEAPLALETAIVRCQSRENSKRGLTVDLVSAVHVAEKSYYQLLNREFRKYDVVLFEMVAPEGVKIPKGGGSSGSPVSMLQHGMKNILELEFQLEQIDYTRKNMVHADMSPEQFAASMQRKGESLFGMFLRMLGYAIAKQSQDGGASDMDLLVALFDRNRALALKRVMAEQFQDMEGTLIALGGPDGSTIISERNKVALAVLRKQIAAGKKKIAIFYGAGHMPDFQQRLQDQFGLVPKGTRWLTAWNLKSPTKPKAAAERKSTVEEK